MQTFFMYQFPGRQYVTNDVKLVLYKCVLSVGHLHYKNQTLLQSTDCTLT